MTTNICILSALLALAVAAADAQRILCYYDNKSALRPGNGTFVISNININICTHLVYAYIGVNTDGLVKSLYPAVDLPASESGGSADGLTRFNALKNQNGRVRTLVAFGGPDVSSSVFSQIAASASLRTTFVNNVVAFTRKYGFNGASLDWQWPAQNGGAAADKANYVTLLGALKQALTAVALTTSTTVAGAVPIAQVSYNNISGISSNTDFLNIHAYDIYTPADGYTGYTAPYNRRTSDTGVEALRNVNATLNFWINGGANTANINLGFAFYGHTYNLNNPNQAGVGAPATIGAGGPYSQKSGYITYLEVCEDQKANPSLWTVNYDSTRVAAYGVKGNVGSATYWVSYETTTSVAGKTSLAKSRGIGGWMVESLGDDDFRGSCGPAYPLLQSLRNEL